MPRRLSVLCAEALDDARPGFVRRVAGAAARGNRERNGNTLKDKLAAAGVLALVILLVAGWASLGVRQLNELRQPVPPAGVAASMDQAASGQMDPSSPSAQESFDVEPAASLPQGIDTRSWMPWWVAIDLLIFVALGLFLRRDGRAKR